MGAGGRTVLWSRGAAGVVAAAPPPRRGGRFIAPCAAPARAARPPAAWAVPLVRHCKVLVLGYRAVGKTSLAHQFMEGKFVECYEPTVESTYAKMVVVGQDEFQLQLVDTAGQDEHTVLPHSSVIGIHGYVLMSSVMSLRGFQVVKTLRNKLYESRGKTRREVKTDEGKKLAESWGAVFLESSARESQVTQGIFTRIIEEIGRADNSYGRSTGCRLM